MCNICHVQVRRAIYRLARLAMPLINVKLGCNWAARVHMHLHVSVD